MGADPDTFDAVMQSFFRVDDPPRAIRAFGAFLSAPQPSLTALHAFARMAMRSPEVGAGFASMQSRHPRIVDAVLTGFDDPQLPRVGTGPPSPEEMDLLWVEFFITGDLAPVRRIAAVLDEPDIVRERLTRWLRETGTGFWGKRKFNGYLPVFARCSFPIRFDESNIDGPLDLDLSVALTAKAGQLKFGELPIELSANDVMRIAAKSAAVWSLRSVGAAHPLVATLCAEESTRPGGAARVLLAR